MKPHFKYSLIAATLAALAAGTGWAAGTAEQQPPAHSTDGSAATPQRQAPAPADKLGATKQLPGSVSKLTPADLEGQNVLGPDGKTVGKVESVVHKRGQQGVEAVISVGGVLGIGAKEAAIPVEQLRVVSGKLMTNRSADALEAASAKYKDEDYVTLQPKDRPIGEFSAFESAPDAGSSHEAVPAQPNAPESMTPRENMKPSESSPQPKVQPQ